MVCEICDTPVVPTSHRYSLCPLGVPEDEEWAAIRWTIDIVRVADQWINVSSGRSLWCCVVFSLEAFVQQWTSFH